MTLYTHTEKCTVCGKESEFFFNAAAGAKYFGPAELDLKRHVDETQRVDVHRCPSCGYCAKSLSERNKRAKKLMDTLQYRTITTEFMFYEHIMTLLCYAVFQEDAGDLREAGFATMQAAWGCDGGKQAMAMAYRKKAAILLRKAMDNGQIFGNKEGDYYKHRSVLYDRSDIKNDEATPGLGEEIITDLFRRAGEFDLALEVYNQGIKKAHEQGGSQKVIAMLEFQKKLIEKADISAHLIIEATGVLDKILEARKNYDVKVLNWKKRKYTEDSLDITDDLYAELEISNNNKDVVLTVLTVLIKEFDALDILRSQRREIIGVDHIKPQTKGSRFSYSGDVAIMKEILPMTTRIEIEVEKDLPREHYSRLRDYICEPPYREGRFKYTNPRPD